MALPTAKKLITQLKNRNIPQTCFLLSGVTDAMPIGNNNKVSLRELIFHQLAVSSLYKPLAKSHSQSIINKRVGGEVSFLRFWVNLPSTTRARVHNTVPTLRKNGLTSNKGKPRHIRIHPVTK
jgi:hypothetical protein